MKSEYSENNSREFGFICFSSKITNSCENEAVVFFENFNVER